MDFLPNGLNVYQQAEYLEARSVPELLEQLKQINKPIKVIDWVSHASKVYCIFLGDVKIVRKKRTTKKGS